MSPAAGTVQIGENVGCSCHAGFMAVDGLRTNAGERAQMIAALLDRMVAGVDQHAAGALATLVWLEGTSDRRPICGDELPVNPQRVALESSLAGQIAASGSGVVGERPVLGEYAAGVVDALLWAYGNEPIAPLI